jgi:hypothetical protein
MDGAVITKIVIFILLALFASWPYFEKIKEYGWFKRLWIGACISFLIFMGCRDIIQTSYDSKTDKQDILNAVKNAVDSVRKDEYYAHQKISDDLQQKQGDIQNSLEDLKSESVKKEKSPPYAKIRFDFATISKTIKEDSLQFDYKIINEGNSKAFGLKFFSLVGIFANGKFSVMPKRTIDSYNSNIGIYPGDEGRKAVTTYLNIVGVPKDSIYYCIKMDFVDSSKSKKSSIKIYHLNTLKMYVEDVLSEIDNRVIDALISGKYWKPPFKQ